MKRWIPHELDLLPRGIGAFVVTLAEAATGRGGALIALLTSIIGPWPSQYQRLALQQRTVRSASPRPGAAARAGTSRRLTGGWAALPDLFLDGLRTGDQPGWLAMGVPGTPPTSYSGWAPLSGRPLESNRRGASRQRLYHLTTTTFHYSPLYCSASAGTPCPPTHPVMRRSPPAPAAASGRPNRTPLARAGPHRPTPDPAAVLAHFRGELVCYPRHRPRAIDLRAIR